MEKVCRNPENGRSEGVGEEPLRGFFPLLLHVLARFHKTFLKL